jgi:hypothetical protein
LIFHSLLSVHPFKQCSSMSDLFDLPFHLDSASTAFVAGRGNSMDVYMGSTAFRPGKGRVRIGGVHSRKFVREKVESVFELGIHGICLGKGKRPILSWELAESRARKGRTRVLREELAVFVAVKAKRTDLRCDRRTRVAQRSQMRTTARKWTV